MIVVEESVANPYIPARAHRLLSIVTWILFFLGMLAWFVQGANRPLDPVVSPAVSLLSSLL
ncbi:MAG TPA: hypothetical protein VMZ22_13085 [Acidimicrobiales bacterium]|nr:hypothetical protein [Acidimicrobiales bacterium]